MATTPNFSWVTPAPTDFVTDLPADFETFADAVDTDVWAIKGTADAALPETIIDAKGDLIAGSAADTVGRLPIGTNGDVLIADSGETLGMRWGAAAGGATLIATVTASGATSVSFSSIPATFKHIFVVWEQVFQSSATGWWGIRLNNDSGGADYRQHGIYVNSSQNLAILYNEGTSQFGATNLDAPISGTGTSSSNATNSYGTFWVFDYANTSTRKGVKWETSSKENTNGNPVLALVQGVYQDSSTLAINQIDFIRSSTQTITGTFKLYGI